MKRLFLGVLLGLFSATAALAAGTATLTWNPNSEPDIAGYIIYAGTAPGVYTVKIDAGKVTTYHFPSVPDGTYCFTVTAYNLAGSESARSNEACKTITHPLAPTGLKVE